MDELLLSWDGRYEREENHMKPQLTCKVSWLLIGLKNNTRSPSLPPSSLRKARFWAFSRNLMRPQRPLLELWTPWSLHDVGLSRKHPETFLISWGFPKADQTWLVRGKQHSCSIRWSVSWKSKPGAARWPWQGVVLGTLSIRHMIGDWKGKGHLGKAPRVLKFLQHSPKDTEYSGGKIRIATISCAQPTMKDFCLYNRNAPL